MGLTAPEAPIQGGLMENGQGGASERPFTTPVAASAVAVGATMESGARLGSRESTAAKHANGGDLSRNKDMGSTTVDPKSFFGAPPMSGAEGSEA